MTQGHMLAESNALEGGVLARSLVALLSLTSDAVIIFDSAGRIILSNSEAGRLFGMPEKGLVGIDVRDLFPPVSAPRGGDNRVVFPFTTDGTTTTLVCGRLQGDYVNMSVRCERLKGREELYLLVAFVSEAQVAQERERDRLVDELSRANRRLSGTLRVVLETLDSFDVGMLFDRVLDEISETLDAWATLVYVAESDGFRLRGGAQALGSFQAPTFISHSQPIMEMLAREGRCLRLRVLRPTHDELRNGTLVERRVIEEESLETILVPVEELAPFASSVLCPVWFGGSMIATLHVGWRHEYAIANDDVRLLEAVAEYLSVQLAGAFTALRAQHAEHLESMATQLRERMMASDGVSDALLDEVFEEAADEVEAICVKLAGNPHQHTTMARVADGTWQEVPIDLCGLARQVPQVATDVGEYEALEQWLSEFGMANRGVLVALSTMEETYRGYLLLRSNDQGPFEEVDVSFVNGLMEDVRAIGEGERARTRDKRISQALQWGMRNALQHVNGISSESCYCSATEEAYVGGDFYDLIRLPDRKACVIMGDVSGKGVEAASVSSAVKTALGAYAWEGVSPARMVSLLNDFLLGFSKVETFATMFVGIVDLEGGRLTYCSAGHPPSFLLRSNTGELMTLEVQSGVVGAFAGLSYTDGFVPISSGDMLLLYTDGTTEARSPSGGFFGEDGLRESIVREIAQGFEGVCDRLLASVERFAGGTLGDDVALVALRFDDITD